jgi:Ca-activated chloride channel family protein
MSLVMLGAQDPAPVFRSRTDLVTITATITDRSSRRVTGLRREDFTITEDGTPQEIAFFGTGDDTPASIGLVVDVSGSMVDKIDDVRDALVHFIGTLTAGDEVFITSFADSVDVDIEFTRDADRLRRAVRGLRANGGTALYDAVIDGVERLARGSHQKKALLIVSDGNDTNSAASRREAERAVVRSETLVYAFGIGHGARGSFGHDLLGHDRFGRAPARQADAVDLGVLRDFAEPSGGRAYLLEDAHRDGRDLIDEAVAEMASELRQQYTLGYYPTSATADGKFRRVQVRVSKPDIRVRTREGYWARSNSARP